MLSSRYFKKEVDKLNLAELANQFCIENENYFYIFGKFKIRDFSRKFIEYAAEGTQTSYQRCRSAETQTWKREKQKNVKQKETKCYLKTTEFFWMLMDMSVPKLFDIYQGTGAKNCFKSHTNSWCPHFFSRKSFVWCLIRNSSCLTQHRF